MYNYPEKLVRGKFIKRYKRFLADMELEDGSVITAHCTNTGSLKSCLIPDADVLLSPVNDPNRKTRFTWESIKINGIWVGVNTLVPNKLMYRALKRKLLPGFEYFEKIKPEVKFAGSRFDLYLESDGQKMFVEVKNVTYKEGRYALFPDAPTQRGLKHLEELMQAVQNGYRAAMFFVVPRRDAEIFAPAKHIHPEYADMLKKACESGVEIYPWLVQYDEKGAAITGKMDVDLNPRINPPVE